MKTKVTITSDDLRYGEYKKGDRGYIDGYVRGGDNAPYAAVVIEGRIVVVPTNCLSVSLNNKQPK